MRKRPVSVLLAMAAAAILAPAASASTPATHWLHGGVELGQGEEVKVAGSGKLTIHDQQLGFTVRCQASEEGEIVGGGIGNGFNFFRPFTFAACSAPKPDPCSFGTSLQLVASGEQGFWEGRLTSTKPVGDDIQSLTVQLRCGSESGPSYHGSVTPKLGKSSLSFSPRSGELEDAAGERLSIKGRLGMRASAGSPIVTAVL